MLTVSTDVWVTFVLTEVSASVVSKIVEFSFNCNDVPPAVEARDVVRISTSLDGESVVSVVACSGTVS